MRLPSDVKAARWTFEFGLHAPPRKALDSKHNREPAGRPQGIKTAKRWLIIFFRLKGPTYCQAPPPEEASAEKGVS